MPFESRPSGTATDHMHPAGGTFEWIARHPVTILLYEENAMSTVNVRYMVDDVDAAVAFYTTHLGFELLSSAAPAFADLTLGDLRLLLSGAKSSAGRPMPDGRRPGPGGWNRFELVVEDIESEV